MEDSLLDYDPKQVMPNLGDDLKSNKKRNKELATYRYSDKAIFNFVNAMKEAFLIVYSLLPVTTLIYLAL